MHRSRLYTLPPKTTGSSNYSEDQLERHCSRADPIIMQIFRTLFDKVTRVNLSCTCYGLHASSYEEIYARSVEKYCHRGRPLERGKEYSTQTGSHPSHYRPMKNPPFPNKESSTSCAVSSSTFPVAWPFFNSPVEIFAQGYSQL